MVWWILLSRNTARADSHSSREDAQGETTCASGVTLCTDARSFRTRLSSAFSVLRLMRQGNKYETGPDSCGSTSFSFAEQINKVLVSQKAEDLRAIIMLENCYGLNCVPPISCVEVLVPQNIIVFGDEHWVTAAMKLKEACSLEEKL